MVLVSVRLVWPTKLTGGHLNAQHKKIMLFDRDLPQLTNFLVL